MENKKRNRKNRKEKWKGKRNENSKRKEYHHKNKEVKHVRGRSSMAFHSIPLVGGLQLESSQVHVFLFFLCKRKTNGPDR